MKSNSLIVFRLASATATSHPLLVLPSLATTNLITPLRYAFHLIIILTLVKLKIEFDSRV